MLTAFLGTGQPAQLSPCPLCTPACMPRSPLRHRSLAHPLLSACHLPARLPHSAAAEAAAAEAGKNPDSKDGSEEEAKIPKTPSTLMRAVSSVKESKVGKAVAKNKFFKWLTYSLTYDM